MNPLLLTIGSATLTIAGLCIFEVVNSLDNAVVNSGILARIHSPKARRFFLTGGMFISVFVVRGIAPFIIYYIPNAHLGIKRVAQSFFTSDPSVKHAVALMAPNLLMAGGVFLSLLFLHWLLVEEKDLGYAFEIWISKLGSSWFFGVVGVELVAIMAVVKFTVHPAERATNLMLAAAVGIGGFFVVDGFKEYAEATEEKLLDQEAGSASPSISDWSKVLLLEVIDASFSVDGVVGAFAFTLVVPFILIGNGIGAWIVRELTLGSVDRIADYKLLANGAFYSIGILGGSMILEGFGVDIPSWVSPAVTFSLVGFFFWKSIKLKKAASSTKIVTI